MGNELFAKPHVVIYRWPDEDEQQFGIIVHTNYEDSLEAAESIGIDDESVLIYTSTLDVEEIKRNFDGLICCFL